MQWRIYGGAIGAAFWAPQALKMPPPNVQKIFAIAEGGLRAAFWAPAAFGILYKFLNVLIECFTGGWLVNAGEQK